jgi:hypothetical protein
MWTWTVLEVDLDAWPELQAANQFNDPPAEGNAFVSATMHVVAAGNDSDPWASAEVAFVTASGRSYNADLGCGVPAAGQTPLYEVGMMYAGAEADFFVCAEVPSGETQGGTWRLSYRGGGYQVFFAA